MSMAHDVPVNCVSGWGKISLPEYLDFNRSGKGWGEDVIAWHVTKKSNVDSISEQGLRSSRCSKWMSNGKERPEAVYLFCSKSVVSENLPILVGDSSDVVVLKVTIPASQMEKLYQDGSYNIGFDEAKMSAVQYRDNIPQEWIEISE